MRRIAFIGMLLCTMTAFAVEPTTSTEFDIQEGRAPAGYVQTHTVAASQPRTSEPAPIGSLRLPLLAALFALVLAARATVLAASDAPGIGQALLRRVTPSRRGPPVFLWS